MKPLKPVNPDVDLDELFDGATEIIGREALEAKIRKGQRLVIKHGVDPTAKDLHLGYAVSYQVMRRFQDAGHEVVLLLGDYTTRIGDPTGKDKTRPQLTNAQIEANIECMLSQAGTVLDIETLTVRRNSEWFDKFSLEDFLRLGTRISAARLWERDMFQRRLKASLPVYVHEFLYPMLQGYDSYMLKADITVIGSDQKFNELMGREMQVLHKQSPQALMIMPLLPGTDGVEKMSQSLGNYIGLTEAPEEQYGKVLSIPDALMADYYCLCTRMPRPEITKILAELEAGEVGPMPAKMRLAREIVTQYHDADAAQAAQARFIQVHCKRVVPDDIPLHDLTGVELPLWICEALRQIELVKSTSEARRVIKGGGLRVDGEVVREMGFEFTAPGEHLIQKGKRHFARIRIS